MADIVVVGGGLGGLPTALELRHLLPQEHRVLLVSDRPQFTFIPSLPWVGLDMTSLERVQLDLAPVSERAGIIWISGTVTALDPQAQTLEIGDQSFSYDYIVIATGARLAMELVSGLGPDTGYTQSVCNPHHAQLAQTAWQKFLEAPGPLVFGAVPGASCFGPAYEFCLLADYILRRKGLREQVDITFVTPEPYLGHLGIGGMANAAELITEVMEERGIRCIANAAVTKITPQEIWLADGQHFPFAYSMLLPPFRGPQFLLQVPGLTDAKGFLPVLPTYQHPDFPTLYSVGVITQLTPPEVTPIPMGVPKTGQMTEAMGVAVAHNIALKLGAISGQPQVPTLEAICFADFGDTGILFLADPVLPDPKTGERRRAYAQKGVWVSWAKSAFERYFLTKMHYGSAVPWFEHWGLRAVGLTLVEAERVQN